MEYSIDSAETEMARHTDATTNDHIKTRRSGIPTMPVFLWGGEEVTSGSRTHTLITISQVNDLTNKSIRSR